MRKLSVVAPGWWDYTTLDDELVRDVAQLTVEDMAQLSRPGFKVVMYDTIQDFYLAEALEYIEAWKRSTPDNPCGICFWGMDEWVQDGRAVGMDHPLSFAKCDLEMCFNRIRPELRMPMKNLHFPGGDLSVYSATYDQARCLVMQGGQGDVKHWAFNDPLPRRGAYAEVPPTPEEYRRLGTRIVDLHPMTVMQNARTSGGGNIAMVPTQAATVGPVETWKSEKVSIWQAGCHDNAFGMRLTTFMISKRLPDAAVPMSLLADHPNVQFNFFRPGIGPCAVEMH